MISPLRKNGEGNFKERNWEGDGGKLSRKNGRRKKYSGQYEGEKRTEEGYLRRSNEEL